MFPPTTPENVILQQLDIKKPVPKELHSKYDLVHIRMLVAAMLPSEWSIVVHNVTQLLKPGGWLQWSECDIMSTKYLRGGEVDTSHVETARRVSTLFIQALRDRFEHGWQILPEEMRAAGLGNILRDCVSTDRLPETREKMTMNGITAILSWMRLEADRAATGPLGSMAGDELDTVEKQAFEDIKSGCYCRFDIYVNCGQKL